MKKALLLLVTALAATSLIGQERMTHLAGLPAGDALVDSGVMAMNQPQSGSVESLRPKTVVSEPAFPGGEEALSAFLAEHFRYPQKAVENGFEGKVEMRFTVTANGKPVNAEITRSVHHIVDREALRLIDRMPDWKPRTENGIAVESSVEIAFDLVIR